MKDERISILKMILKHSDMEKYAYFLLRITLGASFIYIGLDKILAGMEPTAQMFAGYGVPAANFFAPVVSYTEFFAGMLLVVGLLTRVSSLAIMVIMFFAILFAHISAPYSDPAKQIAFAYFFISALFFLGGGGDYSADEILYKSIKKQLKKGKIHL